MLHVRGMAPIQISASAGISVAWPGPSGYLIIVGISPTKNKRWKLVTKRLFVGGLAWATDENALRDAFGRFGEVKDAAVITDAQTGKSRGFGFVTYNEEADAARAIEQMDGAELDGRRIAVNIAQERQRSGPRPGGNGGGFRSGGFGGGQGGGGGGDRRPRAAAGGGRDSGPRDGGFGDGGRGRRGGKRGTRSRDDYDDY
jgi:cold-inducible RNA-binding protein